MQLNIHIHKETLYLKCPAHRNYFFHCSCLNCLLNQCSSGEPILIGRWPVGLNVFPPCVCVFHVVMDIHIFQPYFPMCEHAHPCFLPTPSMMKSGSRRSWREQRRGGIEMSLIILLPFVSMFTRFDFLFELHERNLPTARTQITRS